MPFRPRSSRPAPRPRSCPSRTWPSQTFVHSWPPSRTGSGLQVLEHREDAAMLIRGLMKAELIEDAGHVPFHGGHGDHQFVRDAGIGTPLGDQRQYFALARRQAIDQACLLLAADEPCDHIGVECRSAVGDAAYGVGEHVQVADLLLEHVTDSLSAVSHKVEDVAVLKELGQDQHPHSGLGGTDRECGLQPVIGMAGGHLDVGDNNVRAVRAGHPDQVTRVCRSSDDVESAVGEDMHDPFPDEGLVLAHYDTNLPWRTHSVRPASPAGLRGSGTDACSTVPPSAGAMMFMTPLRAPMRSRNPVRPLPDRAWAPPIPSSRPSTVHRSPSAATFTQAELARACLTTLVSASAQKK